MCKCINNMYVDILRSLVKCKSITPNSDGAIEYCHDLLTSWGFISKIYNHGPVLNLYAKYGNGNKNICIAGHIDVVPPIGNWSYNPWELTNSNGKLYGRGTNDMKGPLSAALVAIHDYIKNNQHTSISVMLTSDEEVMTDNGMKSLVKELIAHNEKIHYCILSESCSKGNAGEYIKIGCKGSLNIDLTSNGEQCHVASGNNHINNFILLLNNLVNIPLDNGNERFEKSIINITSIDTGNDTRNIVPPSIQAKLNIRFNDNWTHDSLEQYIISKLSNNITCRFQRFGNPFIGASIEYQTKLKYIIERTLNKKVEIGTYGGNSDALSLHDITEVVEIGSPLAQAHIVDEYITIDDMNKLYNIYKAILENL
ncbi:MAG: succinyl-diaminopimelate desuccinylase [Alphaproteobacteria bacterium]|nr:succinyl-diaminopimelate desuccinylase [Alphaproteobacteria bacterium]